jgi:hypothetical protein
MAHSMTCLPKLPALFLVVLLQAMLAACSAPAPRNTGPSPESLLTQAGFKTIVASNDRQVQSLPTLPPGQVTVVSLTGKSFYVYPDLGKNQLFVGNEKTYRAYLNLRAQNNMPQIDAESDYFKQDKALRKEDVRDASAPWWDYWPSLREQELP